MQISLRKAQLEHVAYLNTMIPRSVRALSAGFYPAAQIEGAIAEIFGIDTQLIEDGTYFIAEAEGSLVGCGGWSRRKTLYGGDQMKTNEDDLLDPAIEPARIRAFFVDPAWARQGIGSRIMKTCEEEALKAGFIAMKLAATLPGEQLYKRFGYDVIRRYDHVLQNGLKLPLVSMQKKLSS